MPSAQPELTRADVENLMDVGTPPDKLLELVGEKVMSDIDSYPNSMQWRAAVARMRT